VLFGFFFLGLFQVRLVRRTGRLFFFSLVGGLSTSSQAFLRLPSPEHEREKSLVRSFIPPFINLTDGKFLGFSTEVSRALVELSFTFEGIERRLFSRKIGRGMEPGGCPSFSRPSFSLFA